MNLYDNSCCVLCNKLLTDKPANFFLKLLAFLNNNQHVYAVVGPASAH